MLPNLPSWLRSARLLFAGLLVIALGLVVAGPVPALGSPALVPPPPQLLGPVTSIPPTRVIDTRGCCNGPIGFNPDGTQIPAAPLQANAIRRFLINGRTFSQGTGAFTFPATYGVLANVTIVGQAGGGFVTVFPGDVADADRPSSSTVNPSTGVAFDFTVVGINPGGAPPSAGTIAIYSTISTDVLVDVVGYFTAPTPAVLPIASGGTGITTGPTAAGQFLRSTGANTWAAGTIAQADLPNTFWNLNGNAGTGASFLGTTDAQPLVFRTNSTDVMRLLANGSLGLGTTAPASRFHVVTAFGALLPPRVESNSSAGASAGWDFYHGTTGKGYVGVPDTGFTFGAGEMMLYGSPGVKTSLWANGTRAVTIDTTSNVGIGTAANSSLSSRLEVKGDGTNTTLRVDGNGATEAIYVFNNGGLRGITANGTSQYGVGGFSSSGPGLQGGSFTGPGLSVNSNSGNQIQGPNFHVSNGGTFTAGADFAEALPARGGKGGLEPGDVLVLSEEDAGTLELAQQPNDPRLAGVYSTRPGVLGADKDGVTRVEEDDVPLAIVGVVPTKVSAENGPIRVGDLLTTSSTPGYAMKATLPAPQGTLLGKAMAPLAEGTGVIKVLVSLR